MKRKDSLENESEGCNQHPETCSNNWCTVHR